MPDDCCVLAPSAVRSWGIGDCGDGVDFCICGRTVPDELSSSVGYRRLAALLREVVAEESVEAVLVRLLATLRELILCEDVVVWECLDDEFLRVVLVDGDDEEALRSPRIRLGDGLTGRTAREGRPIATRTPSISCGRRSGPPPGYVAGFHMLDPKTRKALSVTVFEDREALQRARQALEARPDERKVGISAEQVELYEETFVF
jgi:hypothetical protein